jgi:hypothetical protein
MSSYNRQGAERQNLLSVLYESISLALYRDAKRTAYGGGGGINSYLGDIRAYLFKVNCKCEIKIKKIKSSGGEYREMGVM